MCSRSLEVPCSSSNGAHIQARPDSSQQSKYSCICSHFVFTILCENKGIRTASLRLFFYTICWSFTFHYFAKVLSDNKKVTGRWRTSLLVLVCVKIVSSSAVVLEINTVCCWFNCRGGDLSNLSCTSELCSAVTWVNQTSRVWICSETQKIKWTEF